MNKKTPLDRSIFIPIFIGLCSVLGICLVLLATRLSAARGNVELVETGTPVKYQYIGTEPLVVFPTEAPTMTAETLAPTEEIVLPTMTLRAAQSPTLSTPNPPARSTNTSASTTPTNQPLNAIYDDADFKFLYTGNWNSLSGVTGAYQSTLHISNAIGDSVQLSFVGQKIRIAFQAGPSLGVIAIKLDNVDFTLDQLAAVTNITEWESPVMVLSSHSVTITHISKGSINIDAIAVVDISTPTPSVTVSP